MFGKDEIWIKADGGERLRAFKEFILGKEKDEQIGKKKERKLKERMAREDFRGLLKEFVERGDLNYKSHYGKFVGKVMTDHRYFGLIGQPGSQPKELYD